MAEAKAVTRSQTVAPSLVDSEQTLKASKALLEYIKTEAKEETAKTGKRNLLAGDDEDEASAAAETPIWLTLSTKRHIFDSHRLQPNKILVPHPINADTDATICLITADPQRAYKNLVADDAFPAELRERITRVIDISHLGKKFKTYEAQRKLFAEHDVFLGDDRIINRLPKALGRTFYKTTVKRPVPVVLVKRQPRGPDGKRVQLAKPAKKAKKTAVGAADGDGDDSEERARVVEAATTNARTPAQIAAEITRALGAAVVHLSPSTNTAVKIGHAGMPAAHVAANADAVARELVGKYVPQRWNNVKALFLKGPRTMALPIWQTDELWLEGSTDVLPVGAEAAVTSQGKNGKKREKANIGKKRKALTDGAEGDDAPAAAGENKKKTTSKAKRGSAARDDRPLAKKAKQAPESNDSGLNKQIVAHKEKLKKQKNAAKKAMDI
ncbi:Ribosomal protein L1 [Niveomyces insectorum RCEF 264]|uniref:Ribosomal protein L1 n=1 Tax=Niveomyces insectorum RCEF 264 TaxID=1081102 RepID=A0A167YZ61_9HYPO|nr:Ribosomal protein L1 [Niveomyces insectorum RCEF 264]